METFQRNQKNDKLNIAVIGCSGLVGQTIVKALIDHPWFHIYSLHAYSTVNLRYGQIIKDSRSENLPSDLVNKKIQSIDEVDLRNIDVIFSAIPSDPAKEIESKFAEYIPVFSTASAYRYEQDIPIFLPIVNAHHAQIIPTQQKNHNWRGFIVPGPNCTTVGLAVGLYPIYKTFGLKTVHLVSMQAISGAGYGGLSALDITNNVIPYIANEEDKVKKEIKKIFAIAQINHDRITFEEPSFLVDCKCNRVPVINGHTLSVFFQTDKKADLTQILHCLSTFRGEVEQFALPNCPDYPIRLFSSHEQDRPQPRVELSNTSSTSTLAGMQTYIGGVEETCFEQGFKMTILSHNTELGAGRGAVLNAEYLYELGYLHKRRDQRE